jgi:SAM-dependent methyltransferase
MSTPIRATTSGIARVGMGRSPTIEHDSCTGDDGSPSDCPLLYVMPTRSTLRFEPSRPAHVDEPNRLASARRAASAMAGYSTAQRLVGLTQGIVVGCGLGADAEHVAGLGYVTVAFDISETAVRTARERNPDSPVDYVTADLRELPDEWLGAFDLVVEIITVQALPEPLRSSAIANIARLTAPAGTLLVIASRRDDADPTATCRPGHSRAATSTHSLPTACDRSSSKNSASRTAANGGGPNSVM